MRSSACTIVFTFWTRQEPKESLVYFGQTSTDANTTTCTESGSIPVVQLDLVHASTSIAEAKITGIIRIASLIETNPDLKGKGFDSRQRHHVNDKRLDAHETRNEADNINGRH